MQGRTASRVRLALAGWFAIVGLVAWVLLAPASYAAPEDEAPAPPEAPDEIAPAEEAAPAAPDELVTDKEVYQDVATPPLPDAAPAPCAPVDPCACEQDPCCECKKPQEPKCPPKYDNRRFMEDWSPCLCAPCDPCEGWFDKIKAVRIVRDGSLWANFGGQIRFRYESWNDLGFGGAADPDQSWLLARIRAHADVHIGRNARFYVEGIWADQFDERNPTPRPIDENEGDILNLFGEAKLGLARGLEVGGWVGRRELQLGKQRLVSPLDWANTRRTFQGLGGWAEQGFHRVEAFAVRPIVIDPGFGDDDWNEDRWLWGVNYTNAALNCVTWEVYFLGLHESRTAVQVPQDRFTFGVRADGKIPNTRFDYDVEGAWQFGDLGAGDIAAGMFSATLGWRPCLRCLDPRVAVGFDYASGDDDPLDPDVGTFHPLFPFGHFYLGHADLIGRQNVVAARIEGSIKPFDKLTLSAWYHLFWRAEQTDAVYNAAGGVLRAVPAGGQNDRSVGAEVDLGVKYQLNRNWSVAAEYAHFFVGNYIRRTGPSNDVDFWWIGVQATF